MNKKVDTKPLNDGDHIEFRHGDGRRKLCVLTAGESIAAQIYDVPPGEQGELGVYKTTTGRWKP